jgi:hypothetical protein
MGYFQEYSVIKKAVKQSILGRLSVRGFIREQEPFLRSELINPLDGERGAS